MFKSLLPPSAHPHLRSIEEVMEGGKLGMHDPIEMLWDVDNCPEELLPWLAWAFSVDVWDGDAPEAIKRDVIRNSLQVHKNKGTKASVLQALDAIGVPAVIVEWFEDQSAPYTFKIRVDLAQLIANGSQLSLALIAEVERVVNATKPISRHHTITPEYGI
jgi:phage tail P2-like protein